MHPLNLYIQNNTHNGIAFKAKALFDGATSPEEKETALHELAATLSLIKTEIRESEYITIASQVTKLKIKLIKDAVINFRKQKELESGKKQNKGDEFIPDWADADLWYRYGFDSHVDGTDTGFYFAVGGGYSQLTNFVLKPIVHIYSDTPEDNTRVTELTNGFMTTVIDMPTKAFLSVMDFENTLGGYGNFMGKNGFGKNHLSKLKEKLWNNYPTCNELKQLGWQTEGFFAYADKIYNNGLVNFNEYGIVTIDDKNYISKSASIKKVQARDGDDPYENDKFLKYKESNINFSQWSKLMFDTYGLPGCTGALFGVMCLFRDIIFKTGNNFPMLYAYGEAQSGKSVFAESISNLFFLGMPAFNLNQGTEPAFWNRLMRFKNCPTLFNEFDEDAISPERFRAFKSIFDGEGRELGTVKKGKSYVQKVLCGVILMGQYLSTKDDNSVLSRTIPIPFKKQKNRNKSVETAYRKLKDEEANGLNSILVELLAFREDMKLLYADVYGTTKREFTDALKAKRVMAEPRIVSNYSHLLATFNLFEKLILPVPYEVYFNYCLDEVTRLSSIMSESNVLSDFWKSVERLMDTGAIEYGYDLKIENVGQVKRMLGRDDEESISFDAGQDVLFLRLANVHTPYMELKRKTTAKNGINLQTIEMYLKDQPEYIGKCKSTLFKSKKQAKKTNTSCIMLKYDAFKQANFIREDSAPHEKVEEAGQAKIEEFDTVVNKKPLPF
jgi:hypothetical protein